jgi:hypothetical protein
MVDPIEGTPRSSHYLSKSLKILPMSLLYNRRTGRCAEIPGSRTPPPDKRKEGFGRT